MTGSGSGSRPGRRCGAGRGKENLFGVRSHARVTLALAQRLGLRRLHLVAHDDAAKTVLLLAHQIRATGGKQVEVASVGTRTRARTS